MDIRDKSRQLLEILWSFLKLGCTSFGGPVAHLGYFRNEFVIRKKWLTENKFADLVALCQFLPGPASSQVGFCIGLGRGGILGGLSAWMGFTAPSAAIMISVAYGVTLYGSIVKGSLIQGFKILALAVVAQAVWGMARALCPDAARILMALAAAAFMVFVPTAWAQVSIILLGGLAGFTLMRSPKSDTDPPENNLSKRAGFRGFVFLAIFAILLLLLPAIANFSGNRFIQVVDSFYRVGALVFGGGHVVLPLIQAEVVPNGWVAEDAFIAGYGAAQAIPGPLFTFSAYLGTAMNASPNGWTGGLTALIAIYTPSLLLVLGAYPFWDRLRRKTSVKSALKGTNAVVVGILLAALYHPVWTQAVNDVRDFIIAAVAFCLLQFFKVSVVLVLVGCALAAVIF